jgi:hypothetical protein
MRMRLHFDEVRVARLEQLPDKAPGWLQRATVDSALASRLSLKLSSGAPHPLSTSFSSDSFVYTLSRVPSPAQ